ncbi:MAG TPA: glycosyltransferase [Candidatus Elarobacter sp.]|nr:glycosyltransferase [Candidatus Elarobacter sp.]
MSAHRSGLTGSQDELDLSIVIPAFNEAEKIERDIRAAAAFLRARRLAGEIIVVDDGSPDETAAIARASMSEHPELRVLSYTPNRGKGYALKHGITRARGRNILYADAGLCVPYEIATIPLLMLDLEMCDIAHGSRRMRGTVTRPQPRYRRIGSGVFKVIVHTFMGIPLYISDTQCGFKAYRREIAHTLFSEIFTNGFMYDSEVIIRALRRRYRILEFPVIWSNDADTRFDPVKGSVRIAGELLRIRFALLFGPRAGALTPVVER